VPLKEVLIQKTSVLFIMVDEKLQKLMLTASNFIAGSMQFNKIITFREATK